MNELYSIRMTGEQSLQHYGVLGMKWGVRRNQSNRVEKKTIEDVKNKNYLQ